MLSQTGDQRPLVRSRRAKTEEETNVEKESLTSMDGCCARTKERSEAEYRDLMNRLNRIEGQIRGIKGMLERSAYCIDILNQVSAATSAIASPKKCVIFPTGIITS